MKKLLLVLLALTMIVAAIGAIAIVAGAEESAPQMNIAYCNLSFSDNIYIKYALRSDVADAKLLIWTSPESEYVIGTQDDEVTEYYTENIGGVPHMIFDYTALSAKQMADVVYARAYTQVDGVDYYSDINKYSILQYAYSKLGKTGTASTNAELKDMLSSMLTYGASAQKYFDYKESRLATADWYQIKVTLGTLDDGSTQGLYLPGDRVTLTAPAKNASGVEFAYWSDSAGNRVSASRSFAITVGGKNEVYTPVYAHVHTEGSAVAENNVAADCENAGSYDNVVYCATCGEELSRESVVVPALGHNFEDGSCQTCGAVDPDFEEDVTVSSILAVFEFGANGSASHADGSSKTSYTETDGDYTLAITGGTNMYTGARDANGNSCIKLGTSSKTGGFSFTVPDDVTSVVIHVAKYKTNTTKITVNGTAHTPTKNSNDGSYDAITVDTTSTKTVTLTTVSGGYRAMVNSIEFYGVASDDTETEAPSETETEAPTETETEAPTETETETEIETETETETEEAEYNYDAELVFDAEKANRTEYSATTQVWQQNGITFANNKASSTNAVADYGAPIRLYKSSEVIITAGGQLITKIVFNKASGDTKYSTAIKDSLEAAGYVVEEIGNTYVITPNSTSITFTLTSQGRISSIIVTFGGAGGGQGGAVGNKMPMQTYDPDKHVENDDILLDAMKDYIANDANSSNNLLAVGLPSLGEYNALVIPVQFTDDKFSNKELADLEIAFNGTQDETGWHSVSSYYKTSSFGNLTLGFDIVSPVTMPQNSSYYETAASGPRNILDFALSAIDASVDLSDYDTNNDGYIDAVYLIYSVKMDRENDDSNYWAFVTWRYGSPKYDGVQAHFYLFASVDFMYEDVEGSGSKYELDGLNINAATYIHETAHLLGLDDYYDYNKGKGSDKGLGGADMMDYTVGDHNVYSKLLLGWVTPTVVTSTQEITISSSTETGQFIMILLDYDGTYFSEYLLIDLYTATGLNDLHGNCEYSLLYLDDSTPYKYGTAYGARIYHVSSSINNPYSDSYFSFTDNNNSLTNIPLIRLIEADGDKNFESDLYNGTGFASGDDLWQTGDRLSSIQPGYTRNDGKEINFDITFVSVGADGATIQITFG